MKKVVLINHLLEPKNKITGITAYAFHVLKHLRLMREYEFILATQWDAAQLPSFVRGENVNVISVDMPKSLPVNILKQSVVLNLISRRYRVDFSLTVNPVCGFNIITPKRAIVVHDLYREKHSQMYDRRDVFFAKLFTAMAVRVAHKVFCVSETTRRDLIKFYKSAEDKTRVAYNAPAIETTVLNDVGAVRLDRVLFVANIAPNKGADTVNEAVRLLSSSGKRIEILHVGRDEINALRLGSFGSVSVQNSGLVSSEELFNLYRSSLCLVAPSTDEGFGIPVVEAQACGLPVICSDIPVFREVAGNGAIYFPVRSARGLADAVVSLINSDHAVREMADKAKINAKRYSWNDTAEKIASEFSR